eukprot:CAMPEP_0184706654 /NCGR_PEP_ID=MMETSP0313-20130426/36870_1 /TAXON_ID=2792 /ORGANISM="Porphyridium aerugineum, Strain SAG 1380-2" /LENGTH=684 /DNA_ID=CAMNT_0027168213 /DNA_START=1120 /DNA_END=3177 /DNA_ORIENTATION=-
MADFMTLWTQLMKVKDSKQRFDCLESLVNKANLDIVLYKEKEEEEEQVDEPQRREREGMEEHQHHQNEEAAEELLVSGESSASASARKRKSGAVESHASTSAEQGRGVAVSRTQRQPPARATTKDNSNVQKLTSRHLACVVCHTLPLPKPTTTTKGYNMCMPCYVEIRELPKRKHQVWFSVADLNEPKEDIKLKAVLPHVFPSENKLLVKVSDHPATWIGSMDEIMKQTRNPDIRAKICYLAAGFYWKEEKDIHKAIQNLLILLQIPHRSSSHIHEHSLSMLVDMMRVSDEQAFLQVGRTARKEFERMADDIVSQPASGMEIAGMYEELKTDIEDDIKDELDCSACCNVVFEPMTLPTGHTLCSSCCIRALELTDPATGTSVAPVCPMTRFPLEDYVSWIHLRDDSEMHIENRALTCLAMQLRAGDFEARREEIEKEVEEMSSGDAQGRWFPVFVCFCAFPGLNTRLHVFEPRYRLMMRRAVQSGFRKFGMCSPCYVEQPGGAFSGLPFASIGTMLHITRQEMLPDGRSLVECIGTKRFKVLDRRMRDGYHEARIQYIEDEEMTAADKELSDTLAFSLHNRMKQIIDPSSISSLEKHFGRFPDPSTEKDVLSFWISSVLLMDIPSAQFAMLTSRSLLHRLRFLESKLDTIEQSIQSGGRGARANQQEPAGDSDDSNDPDFHPGN